MVTRANVSASGAGTARRGFALVIVLLIGFIATAVAATMLATTMATAVSTGHSGAAEQARSLALFGIERANAYVFPFEKLTGDYDGLLDPGLVGAVPAGAGTAQCGTLPPTCAQGGNRECNLPLYTDGSAITYAGKRYMRVAVGGGAYLTRFDDDSDDLINDDVCNSAGRSCLNDLWFDQTGNSCTTGNKCREGPSDLASKSTCGASTAFDNPFRDRNRAVVATVIGIWPGDNPDTAAHRVVYRQTFTMQSPPAVFGIESENNLTIDGASKLFMCSGIASVGVYGSISGASTNGCYCGPARAEVATSLPQCDVNDVVDSTCTNLSECVFGVAQQQRHLRAEPDAACSEDDINEGILDQCRVAQVMIPKAPNDTTAYRLREHGVTAAHTAASTTPDASGSARSEFAFDLRTPCNFWVGTHKGGNLPPWDRGTVSSVSDDTTVTFVSPRGTWPNGVMGLTGTPLRLRIISGAGTGQSRGIVVNGPLSQGIPTEVWTGKPSTGSVLPDFSTLGTPTTSSVSTTGFGLSPPSGSGPISYRFRGILQVPDTGSFQFKTVSDDGSKLFINGALVVDNDGSHGPQTRTGTITLAKGYHAIEVQYFNGAGAGTLGVFWSGPGLVGEVPIDHPRLFYSPAGSSSTVLVESAFSPAPDTSSVYEIYSDPADAALTNAIHLAVYAWDANATLDDGRTCNAIADQNPKAALPVPDITSRTDAAFRDSGFEACWVPITVGRNQPAATLKHSDGSNVLSTSVFNRKLVCRADTWGANEVGADCRWRPNSGNRALIPDNFRAAEPVVGLPLRLTGTAPYTLPDWSQCAVTYPRQNMAKGVPRPVSCRTTPTCTKDADCGSGDTCASGRCSRGAGICNGSTVAMSWDPWNETYFFTDAVLCPNGVCPPGVAGSTVASTGTTPKNNSRTVGAAVVGSYFFGNNLSVGQPHTFGFGWPINVMNNSSSRLVRTNFDIRRFLRATIVVDGNLSLSPSVSPAGCTPSSTASCGLGDFWLAPGVQSGSWPFRTNLADAERRRASSRYPSIIAGGTVTLGPRVRRVAGSIWSGGTTTWRSVSWAGNPSGANVAYVGDSVVLDGELHSRGTVSFTGGGRFYWNYRNLLKSADDGSLAELDYVTPPLRAPSGE